MPMGTPDHRRNRLRREAAGHERPTHARPALRQRQARERLPEALEGPRERRFLAPPRELLEGPRRRLLPESARLELARDSATAVAPAARPDQRARRLVLAQPPFRHETFESPGSRSGREAAAPELAAKLL